MAEHPIENLMMTAMSSLRDMIDVNTIVGDLVETQEGTSIIPISKVSFGFAAGGSEFNSKIVTKEMQDGKLPFGGGSGAGVNISPAAFLVVTGDSMSMVSEACSTGKPTYVYMPKDSLGKKHLRFLQALMKDNYIKEFDKNTVNLEKYDYEPLDELNRVIKIIEKKLKEKK